MSDFVVIANAKTPSIDPDDDAASYARKYRIAGFSHEQARLLARYYRF